MRAVARPAFGLVVLLACSNAGVEADRGTDALLQVEGAQFFRGGMPLPTRGPDVLSASLGGKVAPGTNARSVSGELARDATAVAIALAADLGYWVVPAGLPVLAAPTSPTFQASFGVAARLTPGSYEVLFRAVDGDGHLGPPLVRSLSVTAPGPAARLTIALAWDNAADLDLQVTLPNGTVMFKRHPTAFERPPASDGPVDANAAADAGFLDRDANAHCVLTGVQAEDAIWNAPPPPGHYVVRVDTFSLCGVPSAPWRLTATRDGVLVGAAQGIATTNDERFSHDRADGVLALEIDVP